MTVTHECGLAVARLARHLRDGERRWGVIGQRTTGTLLMHSDLDTVPSPPEAEAG